MKIICLYVISAKYIYALYTNKVMMRIILLLMKKIKIIIVNTIMKSIFHIVKHAISIYV